MKASLMPTTTKLILFIAFLTLGLAQFNPVCKGKRYMCDYNNQIQEAGVCMMVNDTKNKLHLIKPCTNPLYPICNYTDVSYETSAYCVAVSPTTVKKGSILPGEKCKFNGECYSGLCLSGFCRGATYNQSCSGDYDCDIGLFCSDTEKLCRYQKVFAESCTRDNECTNNCACNMGSCVYYYSFDNFLEADNPLACSSGYVENGACYPALRSEFKGRPCTSDSDCNAYNYKNQLVQYGECQCGFNGGGFTYCTLAEGDEEFTDLKNKFAFIVARSFYCHTTLRFGPCNQLYNDEYTEYEIAARYFQMYPQIVFNDPCIKKTLTPGFWNYLSSPRRIVTDSSLIFFVIYLLMFIFV